MRNGIKLALGNSWERLRALTKSPKARTRVTIALIGLTVTVVAGLLALGPIVRSRAEAQAERRGMTVRIDRVRPGFGRVWLLGISLKIPELPGIEAELDAVEVEGVFGVSAVRVHGGTLRLRGDATELAKQIDAWRAKRIRGDSKPGADAVAYAAEGLRIEWHDAVAGAPPELVWGGRYERVGASERIFADLARLSFASATVDLERMGLVMRREPGGRVVERLTAQAVSATLRLDSGPFSRLTGEPADPDPTAAEPPGGERRPAPARAARVFPDPVAAERGPKLRETLGRVAAVLAETLPAGSELDLEGVRLKLRRDPEVLNVGPGRLRVGRSPERASVDFVPGSDAKNALRLRFELPLASGPVKIELGGGPISLGSLGVEEGNFGLFEVGKARIEANANVLLAADGKSASFSGSGKLSEFSLKHDALANVPVRGLSLAYRTRGEAALDGTRLRIDEAELEIGAVRAQLRADIERARDWSRATLSGGVPLASCQAMLDSAPNGLLPLLSGMRVEGTFALDGRVEFDTKKLGEMRVGWKLANDCRITATPLEVSPRRFKATWVRELRGADGRLVQLQVGPGSADWVSLTAISPHMETAVLICEDGRFRRHRGFDEEAIRNSIRENLRVGRFLRGGSTISMQLAKNLYLEREKTLSRKLQEAVLTMLLEQELSKDEILELYLNVIEFGPGIYGIGSAARYYFNTVPSQLSLGQALYLASILPNPKQQHFGAGGQVTPGWSSYLRKLMQIAVKIHRISEAELEEAVQEQVTFGVPYSPRIAPGAEASEPGSDPAAVEETSFSRPP